MRFFLPYTMLLVATVLFLGTCSGCSRWKDKVDVPAPETISQLKQPAEVKNDKVGVNLYILFPQYKYITRHASV